MRALPPFDALVAFEAVLRHGNMTAAAAEIGVTQSAVSHRLRRLEAFTGTPLLHRLNPGLAPTAAGSALAVGLADILDGMAALRERCRSAASPARLRVGLGAALAHHWLVRRLPAFAAAHPDVEVELVILTVREHARASDLHLRILWGMPGEGRASSTRRPLFQERVFPVCRPDLLPDRRPFVDPTRLAMLPLLHKGAEAGAGATPEWAWRTWFERIGIAARPARGLRFEDLGAAISGALEGAGAVLARSLLVQDALAEGRLARVLDAAWDMPSEKAHVATWPAALVGDTRICAFVGWMTQAAEESVGRTQDAATAPAVSNAALV